MILDLRVISRQLGLLLLVLSTFIALAGLFSATQHLLGRDPFSGDFTALMLSAAIGAAVAMLMFLFGKQVPRFLGQREALLLVAMSWLIGAALAALPFRLWAAFRPDDVPHPFDSYTNCYFETMSGLTTTGATVVGALSTLPDSLLLWRATTHWLGGLGIIVLFVAVLPLLGVGGRRIYRIESPGPTPEGVRPRIQDAARTLWYIYLGLTVAEIVALWALGMTPFEAVCHTFATLATGGFSTLDSSIAGFPSTGIHLVLMLFMVLAGVNFSLYHQVLRGQWRSAIRDPELRLYLLILAGGVALVSLSVFQHHDELAAKGAIADSYWTGLRDIAFQVISIQTTTGFCSADFDQWGFLAKSVLVVLMFIGASGGSTGGGIKVARVMIAAKVIWAEIEHVYRPKVVRTVRIGRAAVDADLKLNTLVYLLAIAFLFGAGTVALMLLEQHQGVDIITAATATAATLNNIGPGLALVGATQNYGWFSDASKIVMSVLMVLGRLEVFTILVLLTPRFWRSR